MTAECKRGRPKGTGINDQEMLLQIAHLLAADPAKKRTTAIKEIGITNPSIIRRLRDKYQEQEATLLAKVHAATAKTAHRPAAAEPIHVAAAPKADTAKKGKTATQRPAAERTHSGNAVKEETIVAMQQAPAASAKPAAPAAPAADPLQALLEGFSIEGLVSHFIGQVLGMDANEIKNSPIPALIRQQAQLADLILPLLASQFQGQKAAKAA